MEGCFFCDQVDDRLQRVIHESEHFYAMLTLGPIVEGSVLLVAKEHFRSMFDLPANLRSVYQEEKLRLKQLIQNTYGPSIATEHGRVQACVVEDEEAHDKLCYHAHQIFFPLDINLKTIPNEGPFTKVFEGSSLFAMSTSDLQDDDEYLLFEDSQNVVSIFKVLGKCPRQFLRYLVARSAGRPELASWQRYPERDLIQAAQKRYREVLNTQNRLDLVPAYK